MKFKSKFKGYILILKPKRVILVDGAPVTKEGLSVEFDKNGYLEVNDEETIRLMEKDRFYGGDFFKVSDSEKRVMKKLNKVAQLLKEEEETEEPDEEPKENKKPLPYMTFQKKWYKENEGGLVEFQKAWKEYKKEYNI